MPIRTGGVLAALATSLAVTLVAAPVASATAVRAAPSASPSTTGPATGEPRLHLPAPTGRLPVGGSTLHLTDHARKDPWRPRSGDRQLMVTLWYPTASQHGRPQPYLNAAESKAYLDFQAENNPGQGFETIPRDVLAHVRTAARTGTAPLPARGGRPLVVLSPGFSLPRATLAGLGQDLASRGYVVAAVDHAYESSGTTFPDGLKTCAACDVEDISRVPKVRAADISFLLDRLTGQHPAWRYARTIDRRHVAVAGHSIGGNAAASVMARDRRVDAAVNLDGTFFDPLPAKGLHRPLLMLGAPPYHLSGSTDDTTWDQSWARLHGPRYWFTVKDTVHFSFTDIPLLAGQLGFTQEGTLPGARAERITRAYVGAFLDRHLRGRGGALLDGPSSRYPEAEPQP